MSDIWSGPLTSFASWGASVTEFSARSQRLAAEAIIDTLGCMAAGRDDEVTEALRAAVLFGANGPVPLVGGGSAEPALAALINGTAAHVLDFDDNYRPARSHASAVLVPALLSAAAMVKASGADLVEAYLVGLEAQAYVGRGLGDAHYGAGWHGTSTIGAIGSAAGVARLLGLDAFGMAAALSNAISMASGLRVQFGTAMKPIHAGMAARAAVEAALMARAGISGNLAALDHRMGFRALYDGEAGPGWDAATMIGAPLSMELDGVVPKLYPCCGSIHYVLDVIYDLRREVGFNADEVAAVDCVVGPANYDNLPYSAPRDAREARFSMHYCVALALTQDALVLEDFTDNAVQRPHLRAMLPLTSMSKSGGPTPQYAHKVTIRLKDGRVLQGETVRTRGSISQPFSSAETLAKFIGCLGSVGTPKPEAERLYTQLGTLPELQGEVMPLLAPLFR